MIVLYTIGTVTYLLLVLAIFVVLSKKSLQQWCDWTGPCDPLEPMDGIPPLIPSS